MSPFTWGNSFITTGWFRCFRIYFPLQGAVTKWAKNGST